MFEEINIKLKPSSNYYTRTIQTDSTDKQNGTIEFQLCGLEMEAPKEFHGYECYLNSFKNNDYFLMCKKKIDLKLE